MGSSLKPKYPVVWIPFNGVGEDEYGNDTESWGDPVPKKVYGMRFPTSEEPIEAGHNRLVVDVVLLIPKSFAGVQERDRFKLPRTGTPDQLYEVVGLPGDASGNPFGWHPGGHVFLRRTNG